MSDEPKEKTKQELIEELLAQPVLARLATANPKNLQPHVVPVWFAWDGKSIWISAFISTRKVKEVQRNSRIAVLVEPKPGENKLQAVLLEGQAELISAPPSLVQEMSLSIYIRYLGPEGVLAAEPQSWSRDPENRLIKLTPERLISW
jgi:nitroimidazol reductase NimA-like FMN-containing flavoprotein (pyridoxamine 5'-phosphate oxidase superfamily)